jgi:hypothetical protein
VTSLGPLPSESTGPGKFEVEGIDHDPASGDLRINRPPDPRNLLATTIYRFRRT